MTDRTCKVTRRWRRCVAPVALGNGKSYVGVHLNTPEPGESLDIYVWGAQLEHGTAPTVPVSTSKHPLVDFLQNAFATRFNPRLWLQDDTVRTRQATYGAAWALFLAEPLAGLGLGTFRERAGTTDQHAHNLALQLLAENGVLGLLTWLIPFAGVPALLWRSGWRRLAPLLLGVFLLNLTDLSYYHSGVYYLYWMTLGSIWVEVEASE